MSVTPPLDTLPLLSGGLISIDADDPSNTNVVPFQYNPQEISRSLKPQYYSQKRKGAVYFTDGPTQSISLKAQISSYGQRPSGLSGVAGQLAALEMLLYPSSDQVKKYKEDVGKASLWVVPPKSPRTYFTWGLLRVLPVELSSMSVKETLFDTLLNPIQAEVDIQMEVIPLLDAEDKEFDHLLLYLKAIEAAGKVAMVSNVSPALTAQAATLS